MRRRIIGGITFAAAFIGGGLAESGVWLPAVGCLAWVILVAYATLKEKPRRAIRGKDIKESDIPVRPLYSYSSTRGGWRQDANERWMS